jgi:spermidine synthase
MLRSEGGSDAMGTTRNLEILAYEESPIGMICLRRRELVWEPGTLITEITLDHTLLMSSCNSASEEALSQRALELHPGRDLRVLVGGLGLGCTVRALLRSSRVADVEVVEFLPQVIDWFDRGLVPLAGALRGDGRLAVSEGDVFARLAQPPVRQHDLVLVDVDHSPDEPLDDRNGAFYTDAGLMRAKEHLAADGVLGVWSCAESAPFAEALGRVFRDVRVEVVAFDNRLTDEEEKNWLFFARD